jgi:hypothetical protein
MDETKPPIVFANKIILQMIQHMMADDMVVEPRDYTAIRLVYRKCGGSWSEFSEGDADQFELLRSVIQAWGRLPGRQRAKDLVV